MDPDAPHTHLRYPPMLSSSPSLRSGRHKREEVIKSAMGGCSAKLQGDITRSRGLNRNLLGWGLQAEMVALKQEV